ncbi:MAG: cation:proton antiporter, partial [Syntrophomonadaceae bacterium]|nr:cation:proton antiporter [Syntrophomonadaceae bacterium]
MSTTLILDIVIIFTAALIGGFVADRLKQSPIVGYIIGGTIVGPNVLKLVNDVALINELAELGVILLMFTLGIEFSLSRLDKVKNVAVWGGLLQICGMILIGALASHLMGFSYIESVFLACVIAISSTMIVMRSLGESGDLNSVHGQIMLGILIVQDIFVILMVSLLPFLKDFSLSNASMIAVPLLKTIILVIAMLILSRKVIPFFMDRAAKSSSNEVFLLFALSLGLGVAAFAHQMGLSVSLGAFLAGLVISESEYSHEILGKIVSFRDSFVVLFFVSVGMLVNPAHLSANWTLSLTVLGIIIIAKAVVVYAIVRIFKFHSRIAFYCGMGLLQTGEFSIVMAQLGLKAQLIDFQLYDIILATSIVSIMLTPIFMSQSPLIYEFLRKRKTLNWLFPESSSGIPEDVLAPINNHVILCGYGRVGHVIGRALQYMKISFLVIDYNHLNIKELAEHNIPYIYGDAANEIILEHAHCQSASMVILALPDILSNQRAAKNILGMSPNIPVLSRAQNNREKEILLASGVAEVVIPEAEAGLQMIWHTMMQLGLPLENIEDYLEYLFVRDYQNINELQGSDMNKLESFKLKEFTVSPSAPWANKTLRESNIREMTGCTVVSVRIPGGPIKLNPRSIQLILPSF